MFHLPRSIRRYQVLIIAASLLACLAASQAWAQNAPGSELKISGVSYGGSGCPSGTAQVTVSPDNSALSVLYSAFALNVPAKGEYAFRNCILRMQLTPPVGFKLKMVQIDFRGYANFAEGAEGRMLNRVLKTAAGKTQVIGQREDSAKGPFDQLFTVGMASNQGEWSSCNGAPLQLEISSLIQVSNRSEQNAIVSVDTADLSLNAATTLYLAWSSCFN